MFAAYASGADPTNPLAALTVGDLPEPVAPEGWTTIDARAVSVNHHDVWSLRGVGLPAERLPMILGCDVAGVDDQGRRVIAHAVIASPDWRGDETLDPRRTLLSEFHQGTFAERVAVPRANLVPIPDGLPFNEAACLPTAWLTAYRMLWTKAQVRPGDRILVQGCAGGVASAAIMLAAAAGVEVWATSENPAKRRWAEAHGAAATWKPGERLPARVDAVIETVGAATMRHSLTSTRPGGRIVVSGATSGYNAVVGLPHVFFRQVDILGSTMGTIDELRTLVAWVGRGGPRPAIGAELPLAQAARGLGMLVDRSVLGKVVLTLD